MQIQHRSVSPGGGDGDYQRTGLFWGLKFLIPGFLWIGKFGKDFLGVA